MHNILRHLFIFSLYLFCTSTSFAQDSYLSSPRKVVHTFLYWQLDGHRDLDKAKLAIPKDSVTSDDERKEYATKLLRILDNRGLIIDLNSIPNSKNYRDTLSGLARYILFESLPEVYVEQTDGRWQFSNYTISQTDEIYRSEFSFITAFINDRIPETLKQSIFGIAYWQFFAVFIWILLGLILKKLVDFVIQAYIKGFTKRTKWDWDDELISALEKPIGYLILIFFLRVSLSALIFNAHINKFILQGFSFAFSFILVWMFYALVDVISLYLTAFTDKTESKLDDQLVPLLRKSLKITVVVLGILFILQNNGINVASVLTGLGLGGLAFALAARDTLANLFGSVTIFLDKPFQIGDWIKTSSEIEGTVEEVGFRSTRIRTFYNSVISVPNSKMADSAIDNLGLRVYRRIKMVLNLHYATPPIQMEAFVEGIKQIIEANPHMRKDFYEVHFNAFGAHSLDVLVYCFLKVPTWSDELQEKHNFFMEILKLAKHVGVEFAYPTQSVYLEGTQDGKSRTIGKEISKDELAKTVKAFGPNGDLSEPKGPQL